MAAGVFPLAVNRSCLLRGRYSLACPSGDKPHEGVDISDFTQLRTSDLSDFTQLRTSGHPAIPLSARLRIHNRLRWARNLLCTPTEPVTQLVLILVSLQRINSTPLDFNPHTSNNQLLVSIENFYTNGRTRNSNEFVS